MIKVVAISDFIIIKLTNDFKWFEGSVFLSLYFPHMFWEYNIIQAFWRHVTVFLQNKLSYKEISFCNDSYPNVNGNDKSVSINFNLLLAKYFIFKCKNRKETSCMFQFEISISERRGLEEIIAFNRNI